MEGATAVAAPFFDAEGDCRGSVAFTRPAMRYTDDLMTRTGNGEVMRSNLVI
jgi:DNA-binding IclR family transcriptional regulator